MVLFRERNKISAYMTNTWFIMNYTRFISQNAPVSEQHLVSVIFSTVKHSTLPVCEFLQETCAFGTSANNHKGVQISLKLQTQIPHWEKKKRRARLHVRSHDITPMLNNVSSIHIFIRNNINNKNSKAFLISESKKRRSAHSPGKALGKSDPSVWLSESETGISTRGSGSASNHVC